MLVVIEAPTVLTKLSEHGSANTAAVRHERLHGQPGVFGERCLAQRVQI